MFNHGQLAITGSSYLKPSLSLCQKRVIILDDDPVYLNLFTVIAGTLGFSVKGYKSLAEMTSFAYLNRYELVFVDYHLESFKGTEIAEYVDVFFPKLPVFLVSSDRDIQREKDLPVSIKKVFLKTDRPSDILRDALKTVEQMHYYDSLRV